MANFISTEDGSRQLTFLLVMGILLLISLITVSLRFYCRSHYSKYIGNDDWLMACAMTVAIALGIMNGFHVSWGTGRHQANLAAEVLVPTLKHWYAYQLIYPLALFFVKASILALYHRVFSSKEFRIWVYAVFGVVCVYTIVVVFVNAFECPGHTSNAWAPTFPQGCNNLPASYFSMASINIVTDIIILVMPFKVIMKLNLHGNRRWALMAIFLTGTVAIIASIVRLNALYIYTVSKDVPYDAIFILLWSQIEVNFAIISASAPSLRPLFKETFKSTNSYSRSRRQYGGTYYGAGSGDEATGGMFSRKKIRASHYGHGSRHGAIELYSASDRTENGAYANGNDGVGLRSQIGRGDRTRKLSDDGSEEHILAKDEIMRTVEVGVSVQEATVSRQGSEGDLGAQRLGRAM